MDAPALFKALNGVFCVYKNPMSHWYHISGRLQKNILNDLNNLPCRPVRKIVKLHDENLGTDKPVVTTHLDLSDHPLVIGPRYSTEDFDIGITNQLCFKSSGIEVMGIGRGNSLLQLIKKAQFMMVYHVSGVFGTATDDFWDTGTIMEKSTYRHMNQPKLDRIVSALQANHQKQMFVSAGVDMQSQEAYELALKGCLRSTSPTSGPTIYGMRCVHFKSPHFTLEIHGLNMQSYYMARLIHEIGLEGKSTATCTGVRRIRVGDFTLAHALLQRDLQAISIMENIQLCKPLLMQGKLSQRANLLLRSKNTTPANLISDDSQNSEPIYLPT